jgi:nucleoside-diphosphate-sugar epimerase
MIIGSGLLANALAEFGPEDNIVIFASGVSNSTETDPAAFEREIGLLKDCIEQHRRKKLIYFSTCSVTDPSLKSSPYIEHKLRIEEMIGSSVEDFVIFRVSNIVGGTSNPHTVMNYLVRSIANGREFCLWERAERNFIDIDDVVRIVSTALRRGLFTNETVNIANPRNTSIEKLAGQIERFLGKKAVCTKEPAGGAPDIDISAISEIIAAERIDFGEDYVEKLLVKYYGSVKNAGTAAPRP